LQKSPERVPGDPAIEKIGYKKRKQKICQYSACQFFIVPQGPGDKRRRWLFFQRTSTVRQAHLCTVLVRYRRSAIPPGNCFILAR
jgi:hypothetical protein